MNNSIDRVFVPPWLYNPELVAPCSCGHPQHPGVPSVMMVGDTGMRRWFHMPCLQAMNGFGGFDSDGPDDDEWSDD